ncbi:MAG TPA: zf-HC2 domain-containing protein [Pyrinomonadaceae bacterium]|nr:zf-HC2 domain-containing protein [Pyrinomonadaceae bacterium]
MRECLDEGILQSYFDGELSAHELESVTSHLAACGTCAVTAREIEAESLVMATALAPEFDAAVPTEQLRRRIDAAIAGMHRRSVAASGSSTFSVRAWLQSLIAPLANAPQRTFSYAGLILVLGFAAVLGITQLRNNSTVPTQETVASSSNTTTSNPQSITRENLGAVPARAPDAHQTVEIIPATVTPKRNSPRPRNLSPTNAVASDVAVQPEPKVKLLPGERSYLQTIAKLDSTIKSINRPMRPSLQAEYQRNLALVDRALAATRDAAKKNPNDPDAAEFMMAAYENKVNLLNAVAEARTFNRQQD